MLELFNYLLGLFSQLWVVLFQETLEGAITTRIDAAICLVGSTLAIVVIPLIPVDIAALRAYAQRFAIAMVGTALFSVFVGHTFAEYSTIRLAEFFVHLWATVSLLTGTLLRIMVRHILRRIVDASPIAKMPWE